MPFFGRAMLAGARGVQAGGRAGIYGGKMLGRALGFSGVAGAVDGGMLGYGAYGDVGGIAGGALGGAAGLRGLSLARAGLGRIGVRMPQTKSSFVNKYGGRSLVALGAASASFIGASTLSSNRGY